MTNKAKAEYELKKRLATAVVELFVVEDIPSSIAGSVLIAVLGSFIATAARNESDLIDGIRLAKDEIRDVSVSGWEERRRQGWVR